MPNRTYSAASSYRYGFNGHEKDNELKGDGNSVDFGNRAYNPRIGVFFSVDRYSSNFPYQSPYTFAANNPIVLIDINGDSTYLVLYGKGYENYTRKGGHGDQGDNFKKEAEIRAKEIQGRKDFDSKRDQVILQEVATSDQFVDVVNKEYTTGKIAEINVYSHGTNGSLSLGGRDPSTPGVTQADADQDLSHYDSREINYQNYNRLDAKYFYSNVSRIYLWGCNMGGPRMEDIPQGIRNQYPTLNTQMAWAKVSIANYMATSLGINVFAFTGYSEIKSINKNGKAPLKYDGEMIRTADRSSQKVYMTLFQKSKEPVLPQR